MSTNTTRLVNINSCINDIIDVYDPSSSGITIPFIKEQLVRAWNYICPKKIYQEAICIRKINNHIVDLPNAYYSIQSVEYKNRLCDDSTEDSIEIYDISVCKEEFEKKSVFDLKRSSIYGGWQFMRVGHDSRNLYYIEYSDKVNCTTCMHSFSIENECVMKVSPKEGYVLITYKRAPMSDNGDMIIPDIEEIKFALEAFVLMRIHQRLYNYGEDGAEGRYRNYKRDWGLTSIEAKGKLGLLSLPEYYGVLSTNKIMKNHPYSRIFINESFEHISL